MPWMRVWYFTGTSCLLEDCFHLNIYAFVSVTSTSVALNFDLDFHSSLSQGQNSLETTDIR